MATKPKPKTQLSPFDGREVLSATVAIRNAGDGLSDPLTVDPEEFHHGAEVYVVLRCTVDKVRFDPISPPWLPQVRSCPEQRTRGERNMTMTEDWTEADVLRAAAGEVRERGWCRDTLEDEHGRVCVVGAVGCALGHTAEDAWSAGRIDDVLGIVARFLNAHRLMQPIWNNEFDDLVSWNNTVARDGDEVAETLEKAAAAWEEVEGL